MLIGLLAPFLRTHIMKLASASLAAFALLAGDLVDAANWDVTVGKGGKLKFDPETITARTGDTVTYHFFSKVSAIPRFFHVCSNVCQHFA